MINLQSLISPSTNVNVGDMLQIKSALQALGFELDKASKNSPLPDQSSFTALKNFQRSENLKIDGIAKPNGPTVLALNNKISKSDSAIEAFKDFKHNYQKMRDANTMNADKYFHCKANF